MMIKNS